MGPGNEAGTKANLLSELRPVGAGADTHELVKVITPTGDRRATRLLFDKRDVDEMAISK
ncbi:hypothetical protein [Nitrosomonas sp. Nm33]|uniref:hypothetical protein n=1 Tax=Nitrosomonas sp. Nm33 TaxID=133724 RepID=UPI00159FC0AC|nr:hypothetical protein [Nitrosomonas sp. Nm33]